MAEPTEASAPKAAGSIRIIAGADPYGTVLKDALVSRLRSLNIEVDDLGTSSYYNIAGEIGRRISSSITAPAKLPSPPELRGLVACGTGTGVGIFANKFPGVYAATCLSPSDAANARSINNSNVLAVSGFSTSTETAIEILESWLNTPFKSPCPASNFAPWSAEVSSFLDNSVKEMAEIGRPGELPESDGDPCALCNLMKNRDMSPIEMIPGGSMKIVRESPTSAFVSFKAGSVEPAHHHTFGHDLVVMRGSKIVWNLSKKMKYDLGVGDYLFTPAGDVHRVKYLDDTEFFIKWEGKWDIFFDEDIEVTKNAVENEAEQYQTIIE